MRLSLRSRQATASVPALAVSAATVLLLILLARRHQQPGYAMPLTVLVIAGVCVALTIAGGAMAAFRGELVKPWLTMLTTLLFLAAFITMFSIGPLVLIVATASLIARARLRSRQPVDGRRSRISAGLLLSLGLAPLSLFAVEQPVVACMPNGVSNASPIWTWFGSSGGGFNSGGSGSSSSSNGVSTGTVTVGGTTYTYRCAGEDLVDFAAH
jgi:uncharacterized membrane protein YgcG